MQQTADGKRLDAFGISRTIKGAAKKVMHHFQKKHVGEGYLISIAHARAAKDALEIAHIMKDAFEKAKVEILELSPAFITQGGPQCIAIQYIKAPLMVRLIPKASKRLPSAVCCMMGFTCSGGSRCRN